MGATISTISGNPSDLCILSSELFITCRFLSLVSFSTTGIFCVPDPSLFCCALAVSAQFVSPICHSGPDFRTGKPAQGQLSFPGRGGSLGADEIPESVSSTGEGKARSHNSSKSIHRQGALLAQSRVFCRLSMPFRPLRGRCCIFGSLPLPAALCPCCSSVGGSHSWQVPPARCWFWGSGSC